MAGENLEGRAFRRALKPISENFRDHGASWFSDTGQAILDLSVAPLVSSRRQKITDEYEGSSTHRGAERYSRMKVFATYRK